MQGAGGREVSSIKGVGDPPRQTAQFDASWRARCFIQHATAGDTREMVARHYLGKPPGVVVCRLAMVADVMPVGCCIFALPPRETSQRYGGETWELARLWIADEVPSNAETWLIGQAVRHVRTIHPHVEVLVSYADPAAGHEGVIYRAANWRLDGRTDDERKTPRFDYRYAGRMYSRAGHLPPGAQPERVPRVSKRRFVYQIREVLPSPG